MPPEAPAVHTLLQVPDRDALVWEARRPRWTSPALQRAPWTVVRRAAPRPGLWPVGVRGRLRPQRCAAWLPQHSIQACVTPQMLAATQRWRDQPSSAPTPAISVLDEVAAILAAHALADRWGPAGSVGFELASGVPSTHRDSDLDLVLIADQPMTLSDAARLQADLSQLPVRIDVLLETPHGAVALAEYAKHTGSMLLRSAHGRRWVSDPWSVD
jgi:phosphoribosyl-dephospho-CoA transferase